LHRAVFAPLANFRQSRLLGHLVSPVVWCWCNGFLVKPR
jgi:hypothetical protein